MRILHIGQHHELVGGAEVHRERLMEGLARRGHVCGFFGTSQLVSRRDPLRRVVLRKGYDPERLMTDWRLQRELGGWIDTFKPDLIHVHQIPGLPLEIYSDIAALGLPLVETVYDYGLLCPNSWSVHGDRKPCTSGPGAECFRHACHKNYPFSPGSVAISVARLELVRGLVDVVLTPTEHLTSRLRDAGISKVRSLPYYPISKPPDETAVAALNDPRRREGILVVARLVPEKGVAELLDALALLREGSSNLRLDVIGDGPERAALERQAERLGLAGRVRFLGSLPIDAVCARMATARVLAIPSIWMEALPLVTFDASAAGLPVVAFSVGGLPEAIESGENGVLVPPGSREELAAALERLSSDDLWWARLSRGALARAGRFTEGQHLDGLEQAYQLAEQLARERGAPATHPLDTDQRVLLDQLLRHAGSMEKVLAGLQGGLVGGLLTLGRRRQKLKLRLLGLWRRMSVKLPGIGRPKASTAFVPSASQRSRTTAPLTQDPGQSASNGPTPAGDPVAPRAESGHPQPRQGRGRGIG